MRKIEVLKYQFLKVDLLKKCKSFYAKNPDNISKVKLTFVDKS